MSYQLIILDHLDPPRNDSAAEVVYETGMPDHLEITGNRLTLDSATDSLNNFLRAGGKSYLVEGNFIEPLD